MRHVIFPLGGVTDSLLSKKNRGEEEGGAQKTLALLEDDKGKNLPRNALIRQRSFKNSAHE